MLGSAMNFSGVVVVTGQEVDTTPPVPEEETVVALWESTDYTWGLLLLIGIGVAIGCGVFLSGFTAGWFTRWSWGRACSRTSRTLPKGGTSRATDQPAQKKMPQPRKPQGKQQAQWPPMKGSVAQVPIQKAGTGTATSSVPTNDDDFQAFLSDLGNGSLQKHD